MNDIKQLIKEELTKNDVKDIVDQKLKTKDVETMIKNIITKHLEKDKDLESKIVDITKSVLTQFHKALWVKRQMWLSHIKSK